ALADHHCHIVNGRVCRQRKYVDGFDFFFERVFELLRDVYARQKASDLNFYVSVFEGTDRFGFATTIDNLKSALSFAFSRLGQTGLRERRKSGDPEDRRD